MRGKTACFRPFERPSGKQVGFDIESDLFLHLEHCPSSTAHVPVIQTIQKNGDIEVAIGMRVALHKRTEHIDRAHRGHLPQNAGSFQGPTFYTSIESNHWVIRIRLFVAQRSR